MRIRGLSAMIAAPSLLLAQPLSARTIFPPVGLPGGSAWDDHCPQDKFLVGFRGRYTRGSSDFPVEAPGTINSIRIICASLSAAGKRGVLWYGPERGGPGGDYQEMSCPRDAVILAYSPKRENTGRGVGIDAVGAYCVLRIADQRRENLDQLRPRGLSRADGRS